MIIGEHEHCWHDVIYLGEDVTLYQCCRCMKVKADYFLQTTIDCKQKGGDSS